MTQRRDEDVYMNIHTKAYKQAMSLRRNLCEKGIQSCVGDAHKQSQYVVQFEGGSWHIRTHILMGPTVQ